MRLLKVIGLAASAGLMLAYFNNCSGAKFSQAPSQSAVSVAIKNCNKHLTEGTMLTASQTINFEDTRVETGLTEICEFDVGDNMSMAEGKMRARYEQTRPLNLPANAVICDVEMATPLTSFRYDDVFFMTFNDVIVASNNMTQIEERLIPDSKVRVGGKSVPIYKYDWLGLRNGSFANVEDDYCIGKSQGLSSCQWPISQETGNITFDFNEQLLINLGLRVDSQNNKFGFVITGDNDPEDDCFHEKLEFSMNVKYYIED